VCSLIKSTYNLIKYYSIICNDILNHLMLIVCLFDGA
jgi:hypothetical protein